MNSSLLHNYVLIAFVVSSYWVVSICTVFINKSLLSNLSTNTPIFVAFFQTATTSLIYLAMKWFNKHCAGDTMSKTKVFHRETFVKVFPLSVMFTCMIVFNNFCLQNVSVAFYYIGRSLTTIFNVLFTYLVLNESTSLKALICCILIIAGFLLGVDQEQLAGSLSVTGTVYGVLASLSLSLYSILTKKALPKVNQEVWLLSYYNNIYTTCMLLVLISFNGELLHLWHSRDELSATFWCLMTIGGICGFSIGYLTSLQIKVTSPLTHNVSGTAKACVQTIIATFWYEESKSSVWWLSNFLILASSACYTRVKQLDMQSRFSSTRTYSKLATENKV